VLATEVRIEDTSEYLRREACRLKKKKKVFQSRYCLTEGGGYSSMTIGRSSQGETVKSMNAAQIHCPFNFDIARAVAVGENKERPTLAKEIEI
jgi:hypothetical protein